MTIKEAEKFMEKVKLIAPADVKYLLMVRVDEPIFAAIYQNGGEYDSETAGLFMDTMLTDYLDGFKNENLREAIQWLLGLLNKYVDKRFSNDAKGDYKSRQAELIKAFGELK